jgi:hypothetical protein
MEDTYKLTHALDPTRPVNTMSGGTLTKHYDICCMHNYEQDPAKLKVTTYNPETGAFHNNVPRLKAAKHHSANAVTGDSANKHPLVIETYKGGKPYLLDEFGGIKCLEATPTKDEAVKERKSSWGYGNSAVTKEDFYKRLEGQVNALLSLSEQVWGYCYTQLTDVEQEENGIFFYNRERKYDSARLKAIFGKNPEGATKQK